MSPPAPECRPPFPADTPAEVVISRELVSGEHLIWVGRPPRGIRLTFQDIFYLPLLALLFGLSLRAAFIIDYLPANLFGIGILTITCNELVGRLIVAPWRRRHTWYGLTSERVMIVCQRWNSRLIRRALPLTVSDGFELREWSGGNGVIVVGRRPWSTWLDKQTWANECEWIGKGYGGFALEVSTNAHKVFELVRDARRAKLDLLGTE